VGVSTASHSPRPPARRSSGRGPAALLALAALALAPAAAAEEGAGGEGASGAPPVGLDRLLRLPDSYEAGAERRGGATASEWRARFSTAHEELKEAEAELEKAQREMEQLAGDTGNYQVSAPGVQNPENSPVNFGLRQELRQRREDVAREERALRALHVEADLAEVPESWRAGAPRRGQARSRASRPTVD